MSPSCLAFMIFIPRTADGSLQINYGVFLPPLTRNAGY